MLTASLKIIFTISMITWLVTSGKLDFSLLQTSLTTGFEVYICAFIVLINLFMTSFRWKILLEFKSQEKLPFYQIFKINWIGQFFSAFLPGVVTGDIIKLLYVKDLHLNFNKAFLLTSVFIDRILGLIGLLVLGGSVSLVNYSDLVSHGNKIKNLIHFNFLLFLGALIFIACVFVSKPIQKKITNLVSKIPSIGKKIIHIFEQIWLFGSSFSNVLICILISILVHLSSIVAFYYIAKPFFNVDISLAQMFGIIPIGFISTAIPIAPSGAGVGHYVFDELFKMYNVQGGASLFNLFFICTLTINLLGFIPYLSMKKKHTLSEAEKFES